MHKEYMTRFAPEYNPVPNCGKKMIPFGNMKVLKSSKGLAKKEAVMEEKETQSVADDPELKEKRYEELRAKLFTVEDNLSCDQCEEEEKAETAKESKAEEAYDIDYDRFWPLFASQNSSAGAAPQGVWQQPNPYYYPPQSYQPGYYAQHSDMGQSYAASPYNQYYNQQF
eukprot:TRINITY_DN1790_c0_g1_i9.p2 TRINITY_DN1790_c0_g1~~TRINITY_DN1790_c0_g1_i9.p2  ORF type:complete len:169 (+),score=49.49 TRINITY_DN1790_c0_g1_i9:508-1014(+)